MMKKIAACLLALLLTVSVLPVSAENTAGETSGVRLFLRRQFLQMFPGVLIQPKPPLFPVLCSLAVPPPASMKAF